MLDKVNDSFDAVINFKPRSPLRAWCKQGIHGLIFLAVLQPAVSPAQAFKSAASLERLISGALQSHPAIVSQQAQERVAQAGVDSAVWQFFPTPTIAVEKARTNDSDTAYQGDSTVSTLRVQQPLWSGGRLTAGMDKAKAGVIVSQATLEETRQLLALRVVQAYGDWLGAHLKMLANEKNLVTHVRLRDQVQRRIEQGASAESDLVLAVGRLKSVAADISAARAQKDIALARLGQLLGQRIDDAALMAAVAAPRTINPGAQAQLDLALAASPALLKAQAQARVQEAAISERSADLSPEVYVRAERQFGNYSASNTGPESRVFIGLNSRFGAGLSSFSNIEAAKAQHQAALAEVEVQSRAVSEQVLADHALAISSEGRLEAIKSSLEAAAQVSESYDRQFLAGRKTWLDVMNAARELAQTEIQMGDIQSAQVVVTWRLAITTRGIAAVVGDAK